MKKLISISFLGLASWAILGCSDNSGSAAAGGGGGSGGGGGGQAPSEVHQSFPPLTLVSGQSAFQVLGQNDFTSNVPGTSASTFKCSYGVDITPSGNVWVGDTCNNRVLRFNGVPLRAGVAADIVVGQSNFLTGAGGLTATNLNTPKGGKFGDNKLFVADYNNDRVLIYDPVPTSNNVAALHVIGQNNFITNGGNCSQTGLNSPFAVNFGEGKVLISDFGNGRLLIYNSIPTSNGASADLVIGKPDFNNCISLIPTANATSGVAGAWTDGVRLVVADYGNNRVLIWNQFPTSNGQAADLVLGQPDMSSNLANNGGLSARSLHRPTAVISNGTQLFVADSVNNRILVWSNFPTSNNQPADIVLGQTDFNTNAQGTSATAIRSPYDLALNETYLLVADGDNNRTMIFRGQNATNPEPVPSPSPSPTPPPTPTPTPSPDDPAPGEPG